MSSYALHAVIYAASPFVFWALPARLRLGFLAAFSFGVLFTRSPVSVTVLAGATLLFFLLAPLSRGASPARRWITPALVLLALGHLAFHKYIPPLIAAGSDSPAAPLLIPLGISYYTFKLIHYAVEMGRGSIRSHSPQAFFCYMLLFPIYTAGPVERFDHFLAGREEHWSRSSWVIGLTRIVHGLIKKFVLVAAVSTLFTRLGGGEYLVAHVHEMPVSRVWGYCVLKFLIVYLDFSAYTDLAIGASRLFGIRIMENFNWPILARSIGDFWRRWHMTLAGWCQSYVYLPLIGLTRKPYLAIFAAFLAIGLWHAGTLTWALWGLYHAAGVSVFHAWRRLRRRRGWRGLTGGRRELLGIPLTMLFVVSSFALTMGHGFGDAGDGVRVLLRLFFVPV